MPNIPSEKNLSPEDEIRELERKLQEKKQQLSQGLQPETMPPEKEVFKEVLQRHIEQERAALAPAESPASGSAPAVTHILPGDTKVQADEVKKKETREEQIKGLVEIALTKGIRDAVKTAHGFNPYLLDELHDHLADDYYDKLLALRKIEKL